MITDDMVLVFQYLFAAWGIGWGFGFAFITVKKGIEKLV